ncbi:MAG: hypothetical protein WC506_04640 [Candidatus Micrarchaeia archaeon]
MITSACGKGESPGMKDSKNRNHGAKNWFGNSNPLQGGRVGCLAGKILFSDVEAEMERQGSAARNAKMAQKAVSLIIEKEMHKEWQKNLSCLMRTRKLPGLNPETEELVNAILDRYDQYGPEMIKRCEKLEEAGARRLLEIIFSFGDGQLKKEYLAYELMEAIKPGWMDQSYYRECVVKKEVMGTFRGEQLPEKFLEGIKLPREATGGWSEDEEVEKFVASACFRLLEIVAQCADSQKVKAYMAHEIIGEIFKNTATDAGRGPVLEIIMRSRDSLERKKAVALALGFGTEYKEEARAMKQEKAENGFDLAENMFPEIMGRGYKKAEGTHGMVILPDGSAYALKTARQGYSEKLLIERTIGKWNWLKKRGLPVPEEYGVLENGQGRQVAIVMPRYDSLIEWRGESSAMLPENALKKVESVVARLGGLGIGRESVEKVLFLHGREMEPVLLDVEHELIPQDREPKPRTYRIEDIIG